MISTEEEYTIPYDGNRYCGPAALAYVTRSSPDIAARLLRQVSGRRAICGTNSVYMRHALDRAGLRVQEAMPDASLYLKRLTLQRWLQVHTRLDHEEFIINVTKHYVVIHGDRYFDSMCHLGKPIAKCPYLLSRVKRAWLITGIPKVPTEAAVKPQTIASKVASKLRQLEKQYEVRIIDDGEWLEVDPIRKHHCFAANSVHTLLCSDLDDVRSRIEKPEPCLADCDCRLEG